MEALEPPEILPFNSPIFMTDTINEIMKFAKRLLKLLNQTKAVLTTLANITILLRAAQNKALDSTIPTPSNFVNPDAYELGDTTLFAHNEQPPTSASPQPAPEATSTTLRLQALKKRIAQLKK